MATICSYAAGIDATLSGETFMPVTVQLNRFVPSGLRFALLTGALFTASCGGAPAPAAPRVFFVQPQDGAMVTSPVKLEFGLENYQLAAVPPDAKDARAGMGHHHVGVDTDCLPPDTEIPMANPWVHFGKANTTIDMQLTPGPHKLTLQLGNDLHRTIEGLCTTINVNVVQ
jgi:hypothetical protein